MTQIGEPPNAVVAGPPTPAPVSAAAQLLDLEVRPALAEGRRARYSATVTNRSGHEIEVGLSVSTTGDRLRPMIVPAGMVLEPGQTRAAEVLLRPRRPRLLGAEIQHEAQLRARSTDGVASVSRRVLFVQHRALPLWALIVALPLAAAAAFAITQLPDRVTVPTVEGAADVATAEHALRDAGLRLDPRLRSRTTSGVTPGTILDQIPDPGVRLDRGDRVTLLLAVSARRAVTPSLDGQPPARAREILRAAGLVAGPVLPDDAPASSVVASQLPAAGTRVPRGTAVTIFVRRARAGEAAAAAPAATGGEAKIPPIQGRNVTEYARAVAAAGLVPRVVRTIGPEALGTLLSVQPRPGMAAGAGDRVRLLVSAGIPQLAFDTGSVLRIFDPRRSSTTREASPPQGKAVEPSWSPDGRRLLYRVGRRLSLVSARLADRGRIVYEGRTKYAAATFAPAPADGVVALVRRTGGDGDLCFARVGQRQLRPRCSADRRWDLGRQISWRRGGRELLVFGVRRGHPGRFGILRYRSTHPFSTDPADWRGTLATDTSVNGRGVIAAAYSPSGTSVALISNSGLPRFQLHVTGVGDLRRLNSPLPVRACEVAWRPDGRELAVVQSDDDCARPLGEIVRVDPQRPRTTVTVSNGGRHPAYQPLTYAGPKGVS
jgi:beta-lactam-binding protein with PASTA domain